MKAYIDLVLAAGGSSRSNIIKETIHLVGYDPCERLVGWIPTGFEQILRSAPTTKPRPRAAN